MCTVHHLLGQGKLPTFTQTVIIYLSRVLLFYFKFYLFYLLSSHGAAAAPTAGSASCTHGMQIGVLLSRTTTGRDRNGVIGFK